MHSWKARSWIYRSGRYHDMVTETTKVDKNIEGFKGCVYLLILNTKVNGFSMVRVQSLYQVLRDEHDQYRRYQESPRSGE